MDKTTKPRRYKKAYIVRIHPKYSTSQFLSNYYWFFNKKTANEFYKTMLSEFYDVVQFTLEASTSDELRTLICNIQYAIQTCNINSKLKEV